ncbi:hypothetical protein ZWY2020_050017 [Hordeum vulgare]|nr:hypothetical protein ZWY2020_050017 [Hordeum vulgare]
MANSASPAPLLHSATSLCSSAGRCKAQLRRGGVVDVRCRKRPLWLDGVQAQPRRPLSTALATTSLGELHLPPAPLLRLLSGTWPWLY